MKYNKGTKYKCVHSNTIFYTVGKTYKCEEIGSEKGFYGNDGLFDNIKNITAKFIEE